MRSQASVRDSFSCWEKARISLRTRSKRARGKNRLMKAVRSSSYVLIVPSLNSEEFVNGDCGTGSQSDNTVDSLHGFIIHGIEIFKGNEKVTEVIDVENWRNNNSWILRRIVSLIEGNSSVLLTKSSIQSTFRFRKRLGRFRIFQGKWRVCEKRGDGIPDGKCGAQSFKCGVLRELMHYFDQAFNSFDFEEKCGAQRELFLGEDATRAIPNMGFNLVDVKSVLEVNGFGIGEVELSTFEELQMFGFFLQIGFTLILATLDGLDVCLLGDVISEDDCDEGE
ncbi:hypothetical protein Tco_0727404 [Tanacetum coccineum]|uniref:Uncharacterized protein n=1 Tax=Tanacetum coccineum TaxID=301880 RepID=A0ABQ4YLA6_9ASTR